MSALVSTSKLIFVALILSLSAPMYPNSENSFDSAPIALSGKTYDFRTPALPTLVLIVRNEEDIKRSFKTATALENQSHRVRYLIVADFAEKSLFEKFTLKRAAKRFFKSALSQERISIDNTEDLFNAFSSPETAVTALISVEKKILWESPEHFSKFDEPFDPMNLTERSAP